ncbi:MAG: aminopeptidase P family protein [Acidobacteria bacterium]|nr:aminopeptidase P family protein [Acidobacteriota bacterium]
MERDGDRLSRIAAALEAAELDALACSLPSHVLLLSGYWPVVGVSVAIVTRSGQAALVVPADEQELAQAGWAASIHAFEPSSLKRLKNVADVLEVPLRSALVGLCGLGARIGCDAGLASQPASYAAMNIYGAELLRVLRAAAPKSHISRAGRLLAKLKASLTPGEIERVLLACCIAREAFREGRAALRPGIEEAQAAAHFTSPLGAIGTGMPEVQRAGGFAMCMSGPNSAQASAAYARSRARTLQAGESVLVHCNSYVDGYWTDITRTYVLGEPDARQQQIMAAIFEARAAALSAIRPGVRGAEVDRAAREVLTGHGFGAEFRHATGHGVGFAAIDPSALPRLHPKSPDVLAPGMVFNVEPAVYIDGWGGARHCDTVVVTEQGAEVLSDFQNTAEELII